MALLAAGCAIAPGARSAESPTVVPPHSPGTTAVYIQIGNAWFR